MRIIHKNLLSIIGNTPLLEIPLNLSFNLYAKLEYLNPSGSIKDRSALYMIEEAEKNNLIKPGDTIIEASSGNQAISVAMICNIKGYNAIITIPNDTSLEKKKAIAAYGVKMIECEHVSSYDDPKHYYQVAKKIANEKNIFLLGQYFNEDNANAYYNGLGKEIYENMNGKINYFVSAIGSGGTINGTSKYLKEQNKNIKTIGVYANNSVYGSNNHPKPYNLDGMGINYDSPFLNKELIDEMVPVSSEDGLKMLKYLNKNIGLLPGLCGGGVIAAINNYKSFKPNSNVITIITDSGRAYLSKIN